MIARLLVAVSMLALVVGCATKPIDYRSVWSSSASSAAPTSSAAPDPLSQALKDVNAAPMNQQNLKDLVVSIPHPEGWVTVTDQQQPDAFEIIRKTDVSAYQPTAMLLVYKLTGGKFDPNEAIKHVYDVQGAKIEQFHGMPSATVQASYTDSSGQPIHDYHRTVIATGPPPANQRYLVQLSISTSKDQMQPLTPDIDKIINGFTIKPR
ncbi:MAG TPA: LpqN/LpqT family lipoprotein [Mycobacterium sp.]